MIKVTEQYHNKILFLYSVESSIKCNFTTVNKHDFIFKHDKVHLVIMPVYRNIIEKTLKPRHILLVK